MSIKKFILCGDSWAWGYELVDPSVESEPVAMKLASSLTLKMKTFENMDPWNTHLKPGNLEYRLEKRYGKILASKLGIDEVVDLSLPGASNQYIERKLMVYLAEEGYLDGTKDRSEIFVSIGWTSPERREFMQKNGDLVHYGPWFGKYKYGDNPIDEFIRLYITYFNHDKESALRYFIMVLKMQSLLKSLGIKFMMHQAFYDGMHWRKCEDVHAKTKTMKNLTEAELKIWDSIDDLTFINKNMTAAHFLRGQKGNYFYKEHPNERGHALLADFFYNLIKVNNIL